MEMIATLQIRFFVVVVFLVIVVVCFVFVCLLRRSKVGAPANIHASQFISVCGL